MQFHRLWPALLAASVLAGCSERPSTPLAPEEPAATSDPANAAGRPSQARLERLARRTARALRDPGFRADVKAALDHSTYREGKVQFQRYLKADGGRGLRLLAAADSEKEADVDDDATRSGVLEMYLPVPAHRAAWTGDANVLVATAERDGETPVAFDLAGHRILLDKDTPPSTPVIAVEPAELDFDAPPAVEHMLCTENCGGGGGYSAPPTPGLYMTHVEFTGSFESWLKGDPEYEIHIMGPAAKGDTTNLVSFQCIGEHATAPYSWDTNVTSWSGNQLLFTMAQINAMKKSYPGVPFTIMAYEDDDTACQIKTDSDRASRLFQAIAKAFQDWQSAQGYDLGSTRTLDAAQSGFKLLAAIYSFITTGDDIIGVAISDGVSGRTHAGTNWTFMNDKAQANGWVQLIMR
jgi:hypothetical protein